MKKLLLLTALAVTFFSCKREENNPTNSYSFYARQFNAQNLDLYIEKVLTVSNLIVPENIGRNGHSYVGYNNGFGRYTVATIDSIPFNGYAVFEVWENNKRISYDSVYNNTSTLIDLTKEYYLENKGR